MTTTNARQSFRGSLRRRKFGAIGAAFLLFSIFLVPGRGLKDDTNRETLLPLNIEKELRHHTEVFEGLHLEFTQTTLMRDQRPVVKNFYADFDGNSFYERRELVNEVTNIIERAFDGTVAYAADPQQHFGENLRKAMIMKYLVADTSDDDRRKTLFEFPYLNYAGYYVPEFLSQLETFRSVRPLVLLYSDQGDNLQLNVSNGVTRITLVTTDLILNMRDATQPSWVRQYLGDHASPKRKIMALLDASYNYAQTERDEWTESGQHIVHVECRNFKLYKEGNIWLPKVTVAVYYTDPYRLSEFFDEPIKVVTNRLVFIDFKRRDAPFSLASTPAYRAAGTIVLDRTVPEARSNLDHQVIYTIAADGEKLRAMALAASLDSSMNIIHSLIMMCFFLLLLALPLTVFWIKRPR